MAIAAVSVVGLLGTSVFAAPGAPPGHDRTEAPAQTAETADVVVVTFSDPPAGSYEGGVRGLARTKPRGAEKLDAGSSAVRAYRSHLAGVHGSYERWLGRTAAGAQVVADYTVVANAVAVSGATPDQLRRGPGVVSAEPVATYRPTMNASVVQIGAPAVWDDLGDRATAGAGVNVGIIDSGIDPTHPFFDCQVDGDDKLIGAKTYASGVMGVGLDIVFDHGTHVAGTVAGCVIAGDDEDAPAWLALDDAISGVAPGARLFDYNVFPGFGGGFIAFGGSAFSHDIARALEDSVVDGMDVVNLSLGGTQRGPNDFLDRVLNSTVDAGVVAVVSAGNEGPGPGTIGSPGTAANAITVGAVSNTHLVGAFINVQGLEPFPGASGDYDPFEKNPAIDRSLSDWGGKACTPADGPTAQRVAGTVTLIDRGDCTFTTKIRHAQQAGAFGVLIVNNVEGPATGPGADGSQPDPTIPALGISLADGTAVRGVLADDPTVTITGEQQEVLAEGDVLAGFSSRGPTPFTRALKPELVAPGVNIVSSVFDGGWAAFQGTSMAAPHVAGAAALLLHGSPWLSPEEVKSALVNRADDLGYGVLDQGAGRLDVAASYDATVFAEPAAISFAHTKGNTNRAIPAVTVQLSGTDVSSCAAAADAPAVASPVSGGAFTVSLPAPRTLAAGDSSGIVTVDCGDAQQLRIPWYTRVDRNR